MISQTAEVREAHRFDVGALERYMRERVEGFSGSLEVRQFRGGQSNPTYHVSAGGREYVLRRKPPGKLLPSAHAVEREYRVITALGATGFPVPRTFALCEDDAVIGTAFYVMDCVHGRVIIDPAIPGVAPRERRLIYESLMDVLARLHTADWQALGLADFGRPGNYFARQIHRWTQQYRASETEKIESMERLIPWLPAHIPAGDETALVHGDFRLGNVIIHPTEPRVVAVLDWELSTLGHPLATGSSASRSPCSGWPRSRRASWGAWSRAPRTIRTRRSAAGGRARSPTPPGPSLARASSAFRAAIGGLGDSSREIEERHGCAGALPSAGGLGGPSRPPM